VTPQRSVRVLILGGGFAGITTAVHLQKAVPRSVPLEITVVNRDNFFLFTPMLHEVAASDLDLTHIVNPIRKLLRRGVVFVGTAQGHVVAFADPSVAPGVGLRCSNPFVSNASCVANGFALVPQPSVLADVKLDGSRILTEPALAGGRVFVATEGGHVYMLEP